MLIPGSEYSANPMKFIHIRCTFKFNTKPAVSIRSIVVCPLESLDHFKKIKCRILSLKFKEKSKVCFPY